MSLVARLLEWLLAPLLFLWLATAIVTFASLHEVLDEAADTRVLEAASHVQTLWKSAGQSVPKVMPLLASLGGSGGTRFEIGIYDRNGIELAALHPGRIELTQAARHGAMQTLVVGDESARCGVSQRDSDNAPAPTVIVCDPSSERTTQSITAFRHILIPQSLILFVAMGLVWYGLRFVLRPLSQLRADLDARNINDLRPLTAKSVPYELEPLLKTVNNLMARLAAGFDSQRRFVANAAHQLRTPLAGLHSYTELAQRMLHNREAKSAQEILTKQAALSLRTTKLANQLLSLARSESAAPDRLRARVALAQTLANTLARSAARAQSLEIELTYEEVGAATDWSEEGDATLVEEAIANVLENAISYAPKHSEVRCVADALAREVRIYDAGPGVPETEAETVFHPFVRGADAAHAGTGLGLAIVREIMRQHGGDAYFAPRGEGRGTCAVLSFSAR